jgi:hypothetical protein
MEMTLLRMLNFAPIGDQIEAGSPPSGIGAPQAKKPDLAHLKRQIVNSGAEGSQGISDFPVVAETPSQIEALGNKTAADEVMTNQQADSVESSDYEDPPFDMDMPSYQPGSSTDHVPVEEPGWHKSHHQKPR